MPDFRLAIPQPGDAGKLADIRVAAMRPSLEAIGRFDPVRARERFLASFDPADTTLVFMGDALAGFLVVRKRRDHLYLDHLYICPEHQGAGLGRQIVRSVQVTASKAGKPIRLMALKDSPANGFYKSCGFDFVRSEGFDNHYAWEG